MDGRIRSGSWCRHASVSGRQGDFRRRRHHGPRGNPGNGNNGCGRTELLLDDLVDGGGIVHAARLTDQLDRRARHLWRDIEGVFRSAGTLDFHEISPGDRQKANEQPRSVTHASRKERTFAAAGHGDIKLSGGMDTLGDIPTPPAAGNSEVPAATPRTFSAVLEKQNGGSLARAADCENRSSRITGPCR